MASRIISLDLGAHVGVYLEPGRADYHADANPQAEVTHHAGPLSRAERRNAERAERNARKRQRRRLMWKGVKAGDRPYTPATKKD